MRTLGFADAIDEALAQAMEKDESVIVMGEDVHTLRLRLLVRFGERRVRPTPISEAAFVGAAVGAAISGLHPVVEVMLVDFIGVAMDAVLNQASKIEDFSGGNWKVPMVIRATCGGGYGDGGQHEQSLWGWLAHIPGLVIATPSNPADAGGLMISALQDDGPVVFLEHKLLSAPWLDFLGKGGRTTVNFDVPAEGARGPAPDSFEPIPFGKAANRRNGDDVTMVSVAVGVHRCLEAANILEKEGVRAGVIDLRTIAPLDRDAICEAVSRSKRLLVVDEDYRDFGLSGEVAATLSERGIPFKFGRVCTEMSIPYCRGLEDKVLPHTERIVSKARELLK